jgi:RNA polymerase sigma-70 factor (ECF subfamily)
MLAVPHWTGLLGLLLVALALTGHSRAEPAAPARQTLDDLLKPLLGRAYGLALRLLRNQADAEDLVQEAALAACRGFGTFQQASNFKAWFFRILTNCYYARHRRQRHEGPPVDFDEAPELYLYGQMAELGLHEGTTDPAGALLNRLDGEQIARALQGLPEEYRVVSTLYCVEDLSYQEIADILGIPVGTVRSRLHRGRRILQKLLWRVAVERGVVPEAAKERP